jgi:hypothetical protein
MVSLDSSCKFSGPLEHAKALSSSYIFDSVRGYFWTYQNLTLENIHFPWKAEVLWKLGSSWLNIQYLLKSTTICKLFL